MIILIPTPVEALELLSNGHTPDFEGIYLVEDGGDGVLTELVDTALDIIEFTNHVHEPELFSGDLNDRARYTELAGGDELAVEAALALGNMVACHLAQIEAADQGDEPISHLLVRSLRLAIIGSDISTDGTDALELNIVELGLYPGHEADVALYGVFDDDTVASIALGFALFTFNLIKSHFAPGETRDENGQSFDAYLDAIEA